MSRGDKQKKNVQAYHVKLFGDFAFFDPEFEGELFDLLDGYAHGEANVPEIADAFRALYIERVLGVVMRWMDTRL